MTKIIELDITDQAAENISESAKPNSIKPIKFVHLCSNLLANQSMLNGAIMIETAKTSAVVFIKARE